jgi:lactate dehydrogenase-like 2-hydroxyacid dehydrogenase
LILDWPGADALPIQPWAIERAAERGWRFAPEIGRADAIVTRGAGLDAADIARAERCQIVVHAGIGSGGTDLEAARAAGIPVASIPDAETDDLVALTLALVGEARASKRPPRRLGLIGLGRVGREVAKRAAEAGWEVWARDPFAKDEAFIQSGARRAPPLDLLGVCDVVSLHVPLCEATRRFIDASRLEWMRPSARFINLSHPELADVEAVARAVAEGRLGGAALLAPKGWKGAAENSSRAMSRPWHRSPGEVRMLRSDLPPSASAADLALRRAIEIVADYLDGRQPEHLLIDPALPRLVAGSMRESPSSAPPRSPTDSRARSREA